MDNKQTYRTIVLAILLPVYLVGTRVYAGDLEVTEYSVALEGHATACPGNNIDDCVDKRDPWPNGSITDTRSGSTAWAVASNSTGAASVTAWGAAMQTNNFGRRPGNPRYENAVLDNPRTTVETWNSSSVSGWAGWGVGMSIGKTKGKLKVKQAGRYIADVTMSVDSRGNDVLLGSMQILSVEFGPTKVKAWFDGARWRWRQYYNGNPIGSVQTEATSNDFGLTASFAVEGDGEEFQHAVNDEIPFEVNVDIVTLGDQRHRNGNVFGKASLKFRRQ